MSHADNEWPPLEPWNDCLPVLHHLCGTREVGYPGTRRHGPDNCETCQKIEQFYDREVQP